MARSTRDAEGAGPARYLSGTNVLLGAWLVVAPWVLGYSTQTNATWNQVVVGAVIAVLAAVRAVAPHRSPELSWINLALGGWLVVAPFLLRYGDTGDSGAIYWNDIVVGLLVFLLAGMSAMVTHKRSKQAVDIPRGPV